MYIDRSGVLYSQFLLFIQLTVPFILQRDKNNNILDKVDLDVFFDPINKRFIDDFFFNEETYSTVLEIDTFYVTYCTVLENKP